ncbi:MAG TPA: isoleucine--tRNA ligase [Chthoniobacteraceae bacterium]|jgi:isoleucyl-tRNA synthetase|nr:isoleucine--tRNA ligase [Chthoniobacteraceae bacterium]
MSEKNYKETLNLPKTTFPMKADLVAREPARLAQWEASGLYERILAARADAPLFTLHDGPPFANGDVHMGTALNKVLKDIVVKSQSMLGRRAPFVPGWDCHGLPIEFKVVKESRGLSPLEVRKRSEEYARKYINIQRGQFKRLGVLGDWEHPYLTLDPAYEAEIIRAFAGFVDAGLVYQSRKPVYWSTGAQTALAEAEVEYADREDPAIFVKFPLLTGSLAGKASMAIWTTTPWTLPANVGIAVHPQHKYVAQKFRHRETGAAERFVIAESLIPAFTEATPWELEVEVETYTFPGTELAGALAQHPFLDRTSKVIVANFVTLDTGTGGVHIAPGHGADDYIAGLENGLPLLSPVDDHGRFTEEVGVPIWAGRYVFDANKDVVELLRERGALLGEQIYRHSYPHCWRSKTPVVFRAVEQFFIRISEFRAKALAAIDTVHWVPAWGRNRIYGTVESRPDWCISRQRSWGVPLPVFYGADGKPLLDGEIVRKVADLFEQHGTNLWFEKDDAWWAQALGLQSVTRRNDTLDVWIDSGVSHQAVVRKRLGVEKADVYLEATDQHRGWFQSSLMTRVALNGDAPYRTCITHGFVVDKDTRKKVSKSAQGTYTKPMDAGHFVGKYGADIVRLWASSVEFTSEVPFSEESFALLADAYRQFRNVLRILLANSEGFTPGANDMAGATLIDRWLRSRLQQVIATCREAYAAYDFRKVFQTLNQFCTVDLSALYVDITKDRLYCDGAESPRRRATQAVMREAFQAVAALLAPILAFTTDEAWEFSGRTDSIHLELFPQPAGRDPQAEEQIDQWLKLRGVIAQAVEPARQQKLIGNALEANVTLQTPDAAELRGLQAELEEFLILSELHVEPGAEPSASLTRTRFHRCERCWRYRAEVGASAAHPDLCARCEGVVGKP